VTADRDCTWTAATDVSWISIGSARDGQGTATIAYAVTPNGTPVSRRGGIAVGSAHVDITQDGAPCRFNVDASSLSETATGGSATIHVDAMSGCSWTAASRTSWIVVVGGSTGNGAGQVVFNIRPNTADARTGDVTIADRTISVAQAGVSLAPAPNPPPAPNPTPAPPPTPSPAPAPSPTPPPPPSPPPPPPPPPGPRDQGDHVDFSGRLGAVSGSCPTITFQIDGRTYLTNRDTKFHKSSCDDLTNGVNVEGKGHTQQNGVIVAENIDVKRGQN
jgi:hypothetical protein